MSFSEYSFSTAAGVLGGNLTAVSAAARRYGIQRTELDAELILPQACRGEIGFDTGIAAAVRENLCGGSLNISSLTFRINPAAEEEASRRRGIELFMTITAYAKALGADMVCTGSGRAADSAVTRSEEGLQRLADSLRPIISRAECRGVNVALEIAEDAVLYSPERAMRLSELVNSERLGFSVPLNAFRGTDMECLSKERLFAVRVTDLSENKLSNELSALESFAAGASNTAEIILDGIPPVDFLKAVEKLRGFELTAEA